jgi:hypothetical protein
MSNTNTATASATSQDWFTGDVPGGDLSLDDIFPVNSGVQQTTAPTTEIAAPVTPTAQPTPASQAQPNFEIRAKDSVYKTVEAAQRGVEEKDALIEKLRQRYIMERGIDPVTERRVPLNEDKNVPVNYMQDNKRYMQDLKTAVDKGDENAYFQAQAKLVFDLLSPLAGTINNAAKEQAVQALSTTVPEFQTFRNSPEFAAVLSENPSLKSAIETSENDFRGHAQLPELYRLAYFAAQGRRVPDLIKQATAAAAQAAPTQQVRPTLGQNTVAPPSQHNTNVTLDVSTPEGRKAIIAQFEQSNGRDFKF